MIYEAAEEAAFRQRLLTHPGERQHVDYKASKAFAKDDDFSLKLIRHIQGLANVGGGWIVIGFADGNPPTPDLAHSDVICKTYDPTPLGQAANSYVEKGQELAITVFTEAHPTTGLQYPAIRIQGFERLPFICRSDKKASDSNQMILRQGSVYVRRPGAETVSVSKPADWEALISRCMRLRRDELLGEFRELFERMTSSSPAPASGLAKLQEFTEKMRERRDTGGGS